MKQIGLVALLGLGLTANSFSAEPRKEPVEFVTKTAFGDLFCKMNAEGYKIEFHTENKNKELKNKPMKVFYEYAKSSFNGEPRATMGIDIDHICFSYENGFVQLLASVQERLIDQKNDGSLDAYARAVTYSSYMFGIEGSRESDRLPLSLTEAQEDFKNFKDVLPVSGIHNLWLKKYSSKK